MRKKLIQLVLALAALAVIALSQSAPANACTWMICCGPDDCQCCVVVGGHLVCPLCG